MQVQTRSIKMKRRLSQRTLGNDADNLEAIKEGPRQEVANNPTVGQTSGVQLCDEDDLEAIIEELIKVRSYPSIFLLNVLSSSMYSYQMYLSLMLSAIWCFRDSLKLVMVMVDGNLG